MEIKLETLTPIHIGSGEEISPIGYVVENGYVKIVNLYELLKDESFDKKGFVEYVERCADNRRIPYIGYFDKRILDRHVEYSLKLKANLSENRLLNIKESVNVNGRFYIPGSSIKGSLLSAIYWKKLKEMASNEDKKEIIVGCLTRDFRIIKKHHRRYPHFIQNPNRINPENVLINMLFDAIVEEEAKKYYVKKRKNTIKFAPWLMVSDTSFTSEASVIEIRTFGAKGRGIPIVYEAIDYGVKLELEIKRQKSVLNENEILKIADEFYSRVLERDREWWKSRSMRYPEIKGRYKLRIGQGSSCLATSLLILSEELGVKETYLRKWKVTTHGYEPRTRKIFFEGNRPLPLGWVKVKS